ncbi:hypothetical protein chiPu_0033497 [Chiloscyllium punctatum]|uniref:RNA polymerase II elongation factor ELL N-terminal domain-containing protein n=1 Tax=Chiloscyllium punctatum TaxID=137246 RepID=A0A401U2V4_CHIPU|nr:hypothetical protein [Chiloscyllium punctatum]
MIWWAVQEVVIWWAVQGAVIWWAVQGAVISDPVGGVRGGEPVGGDPGAGRSGEEREAVIQCRLVKMAALGEERRFGLSCEKLNRGARLSLFHVKLTDSAVRALEAYRRLAVSELVPGTDGRERERARARWGWGWEIGG